MRASHEWFCFTSDWTRKWRDIFKPITKLNKAKPTQVRIKAAKYEIQKPSTCRATRANLMRDKLWVWWKTSIKAKMCCSELSWPVLYFSQQLSSKIFATSWSHKVKNAKRRPKTCNVLYLVFRRLFNLSRNIVSLRVFVDLSRFSPCVINLTGNKNDLLRVEEMRRADWLIC